MISISVKLNANLLDIYLILKVGSIDPYKNIYVPYQGAGVKAKQYWITDFKNCQAQFQSSTS